MDRSTFHSHSVIVFLFFHNLFFFIIYTNVIGPTIIILNEITIVYSLPKRASKTDPDICMSVFARVSVCAGWCWWRAGRLQLHRLLAGRASPFHCTAAPPRHWH